MPRWTPALAVVVAVAAASSAVPASPLHRLHDPIVLAVSALPGAVSRSSGELSLHRWAGSGLEPIPAQFDARGEDGEIDVAVNGDFILEGDDELVFMARDTGLRAPAGALPPTAMLQVEIEDPVNGEKAWAYLLEARREVAPAAPYVVLDAERRRAASPYYDVEYADGRNFFTAMRIPPAGGGDGSNFLRQTRMRGEPRFSLFFTDVTLSFTENNSIVRVEGIRNGPVRSIRRVHLSVDLGPLFPELPSGTVYTLHYLTSFSTPTRISIPWIALKALQDFRFENVLEFDESVATPRYFDAAHPGGIPLGARADAMVEPERDHDWYAVSGAFGTVVQVFLLPEEWRRWGIARGAVLRSAADDSGPSAPSVAGFSLLHMTRLARHGVHELRQATVVLPRPYQPGDEAEALAMFHAPLRASVLRLGGE